MEPNKKKEKDTLPKIVQNNPVEDPKILPCQMNLRLRNPLLKSL